MQRRNPGPRVHKDAAKALALQGPGEQKLPRERRVLLCVGKGRLHQERGPRSVIALLVCAIVLLCLIFLVLLGSFLILRVVLAKVSVQVVSVEVIFWRSGILLCGRLLFLIRRGLFFFLLLLMLMVMLMLLMLLLLLLMVVVAVFLLGIDLFLMCVPRRREGLESRGASQALREPETRVGTRSRQRQRGGGQILGAL